MPRRSSRNDDVVRSISYCLGSRLSCGCFGSHCLLFHSLVVQMDSLAGGEGNTRRNPRRGGNKPAVQYKDESQDTLMEDNDENQGGKDSSHKDAGDDDDDEVLVVEEEEDESTTTEEEKPAARRKRKSPRNDEASPPRKSSRSTKYTSSMAEPSESSGLLVDAAFGDGNDDEDDGDKKKKAPSKRKTAAAPAADHHKSPARRHARKRLSIQPGGSADSDEDSDDYDSDDSVDNEEEEADEEPLKMQRIIASRTERVSTWRDICRGFNTSEIDNGSRWFQEPNGDDDAEDSFEERFLIKWTDLSFLHCSWESRKDLFDQVDGAKTYLSTFFRKSQDGYLYGPDERNDGKNL